MPLLLVALLGWGRMCRETDTCLPACSASHLPPASGIHPPACLPACLPACRPACLPACPPLQTYNYGVESYDVGEGFGHFGIAAPDVAQLVEAVQAKGG